MKPIPEWRRVAKLAWSVRLALLSAILGAVELALPLFSEVVPRHLFASLSMLVAVAAAVARVVAQPAMHRDEP